MRLAELEIDPAQLDSYKAALKEEIEASIRLEPGVLTLFAVSVKDHSYPDPDVRDVCGRSCLQSAPRDSSFQGVQKRERST